MASNTLGFMTLSGYVPGIPGRDDLEAIAAVLIATGTSTLGADFVRGEWGGPGFDLANDAWVVTDESEVIVAYGQVLRVEQKVLESWGVVHPSHRGKGIGAWLLDRMRERASGSVRLRHKADADDKDVAELLRAKGFLPVRHFWHMQVDLPLERGAPADERIRHTTPDDQPAIHAIITQALAAHWGFQAAPFERWLEEEAGSDGLLAIVAGVPVGALTYSLGDDKGWIDYLGVLESHRGKGIATQLLREAFARLTDRGASHVLVSVDSANETGATSVYERAGMRVVYAWDMWEA